MCMRVSAAVAYSRMFYGDDMEITLQDGPTGARTLHYPLPSPIKVFNCLIRITIVFIHLHYTKNCKNKHFFFFYSNLLWII